MRLKLEVGSLPDTRELTLGQLIKVVFDEPYGGFRYVVATTRLGAHSDVRDNDTEGLFHQLACGYN